VSRISSRHVGASILAFATATVGLSACMTMTDKPSGPVNAQNWTAAEQLGWYRTSQGSRLIPERWLLALEAPGSAVRFMARAHFDQFLYLRERIDDPESWPIGFARDDQSDTRFNVTSLRWYAGQKDKEPWVGLNCAACHTAEIRFNDQPVRVDGAPTLADFQGFTDRLLLAMQETWSDEAKWDRFAVEALKPRDSKDKVRDNPANRARLRTAFRKLLDHQEALAVFNRTGSDYGHGRLDAVGHILNKVAFLNEAPDQMRGEPDAPVSYPFIWNAAQHDFLQWNGLVPNDKLVLGGRSVDAGALVRNTSEVIGVFADVKLRPNPSWSGFQSSVWPRNLMAMEILLAKLKSPAWPESFPVPDPNRVRLGKRLFARDCAGCHAPLDRDDLKSPIKAEMTPIWDPLGVATDPWMACNTFSYQALGGLIAGTPENVVGGDPLPGMAPMRLYLKTQAVGTLLARKWEVIWNALRIWAGNPPDIDIDPAVTEAAPGVPVQKPREVRLKECVAAADQLPTKDNKTELRILAYKGRPLNGIWATAPYLHNGSVRTLWDLLLPPAKRQTEFWVGNREFEPKVVGFKDAPPATGFGSKFSTHGPDGKPIHGNSNAGHDYRNADYSNDERWALVEYMKTL
jgi:hypothetical protein